VTRKLPPLTSADRMLAAEACDLKAVRLEEDACREEWMSGATDERRRAKMRTYRALAQKLRGKP
jgi:hypothetical protein